MKKIIGRILLILLLVVIIVVGLFTYSAFKKGDDFYIFGYKPYIVKSGSMNPTIKLNSVVMIKKGNFEDLKVKDVIVFSIPDTDMSSCHEIVDITPIGITTKGINNKYVDDAIINEDLYKGKVVSKMNFISDYVTVINDKGIFIAVILPIIVIGLLIFCLCLLFKKHDESDDLFKEDSEVDNGDDVIKEEEGIIEESNIKKIPEIKEEKVKKEITPKKKTSTKKKTSK